MFMAVAASNLCGPHRPSASVNSWNISRMVIYNAEAKGGSFHFWSVHFGTHPSPLTGSAFDCPFAIWNEAIRTLLRSCWNQSIQFPKMESKRLCLLVPPPGEKNRIHERRVRVFGNSFLLNIFQLHNTRNPIVFMSWWIWHVVGLEFDPCRRKREQLFEFCLAPPGANRSVLMV